MDFSSFEIIYKSNKVDNTFESQIEISRTSAIKRINLLRDDREVGLFLLLVHVRFIKVDVEINSESIIRYRDLTVQDYSW